MRRVGSGRAAHRGPRPGVVSLGAGVEAGVGRVLWPEESAGPV
jgi:hypothetical protein